MSKNKNKNKNANYTPQNSVSEKAPKEMTEAILAKRVQADFEKNILKKDSALEEFNILIVASEEPDLSATQSVAVTYRIRNMILGDHLQAVREHFDDNTEAVNNFVSRIKLDNASPKG